MMRMPGGCFEQTSSSAYPNVLIVDYIKKNRVASPQMLMKAEQSSTSAISACSPSSGPARVRLVGREEPLIWTSAYGLQQFSDMSKVYRSIAASSTGPKAS